MLTPKRKSYKMLEPNLKPVDELLDETIATMRNNIPLNEKAGNKERVAIEREMLMSCKSVKDLLGKYGN